jgi:hypothetical protein
LAAAAGPGAPEDAGLAAGDGWGLDGAEPSTMRRCISMMLRPAAAETLNSGFKGSGADDESDSQDSSIFSWIRSMFPAMCLNI